MNDLLTEAEWDERVATREDAPPHPLCALLRELRTAARLSLSAFEARSGFPAVVVGAYERGDRLPPLPKLDLLLGFYGYALRAVPVDRQAVQLPADMAGQLRAIADQIEVAARDST